jgi:predicted O-linked N-acetylglucosamine transferase (SPINDLY family)
LANLRAEAGKRGVAPERLIFAPRMAKVADHFARHRHADLFLDTSPYNAHATGANALWAGVPMVSCPGDSFPSRVGASLLKAVGLPELIAGSLEEYEALAIKFAREPALLSAIKERLAQAHGRAPLFDSKRQARNLEAAYATMMERYRRNELPAHFAIAPAQT